MTTQDAPSHERIGTARRAWLAAEMLALYVGAPILVFSLVRDYRLPLFQILPAVFALFVLLLTLDRSFSWREALSRGFSLRTLGSIVGLFVLAVPVMAAFAWFDNPRGFLRFPLYAQDTWIMVMLLYPILSVTAQEIMFRLFFFHRYRSLFGVDAQGVIVLNAVLFAFAHIPFQNVTTLVMSFFASLLWAWRYEHTRSYWAVVLEHSLYGNLIFTVGLGRYFYTGVSNF
jgi:membrane protease YdiL (CAAX protease family)